MKTTLLFLAAMMTMAAQGFPARITATIPFPFDVNGVTMAAGRYEVEQTGHHQQMIVRNRNDRKAVIVSAPGREDDSQNAAIFEFRRYGGTYFLSAVKYRGQDMKLRLTPAKRERELARTARAEQVAVAAE